MKSLSFLEVAGDNAGGFVQCLEVIPIPRGGYTE